MSDQNGFEIVDKVGGLLHGMRVLERYDGPGGVVTVPEGVQVITGRAFWHRTDLTGVILPKGVHSIGRSAFEKCMSLTDIILPEGLTYIGVSAFEACTSLTGVVLPEGLQRLDSHAFEYCKNLRSVTFPQSLEYVHTDVFDALTEVTVKSWTPVISKAVSGCPVTTIHTEEISSVPAKFRALAAWGFVSEGPEDLTTERAQEHMAYLKRNAGKLAGLSMEHPELLRFLLEHKLLKEKDLDAFHGEAAERGDQEAENALGQYRAEMGMQPWDPQEYTRKKQREAEAEAAEKAASLAADGDGYRPDLTLKKPNELKKVQVLEEAVLKGTLDDLKAVLETYQPFELTARALGLAARYRGLDFVRLLVKHGASFVYKVNGSMQTKYQIRQATKSGGYLTLYYLMLVPEKLLTDPKSARDNYSYSPMYGVSFLGITEEQEEKALSMEQRIEVTKYLSQHKKLGVSLDDMLYWALTRGELDFADALLEMDARLDRKAPSYYERGERFTYLDTITTGNQSVYWFDYLSSMSKLKEGKLRPVLERLHAVAAAAGRQLPITQKLFEEIHWTDDALAFAVESLDISRLNQKALLETAVSGNAVAALEKMAEAGWLSQRQRREKLIAYAMEHERREALAWLMDFKNRTVDIAAEAAKEETRMMKELTADPNSAAVLKKTWSYSKLKDGTLMITSYKGSDTEVEVPAVIGKAKVTVIGPGAFEVWYGYAKNPETRKQITSILLPDGIREIRAGAFIGCKSLKRVMIPKDVKMEDGSVFWGCDALVDSEGFIIVNEAVFSYRGGESVVRVPEGVKTVLSLRPNMFSIQSIQEVILPEGVQTIGPGAFEDYKDLHTVNIPASVREIGEKAFSKTAIAEIDLPEGLRTIGPEAFAFTPLVKAVLPDSLRKIGKRAFYVCGKLRDVYLSGQTKTLGAEILGSYDNTNENHVFTADGLHSDRPTGICVHTPAGSPTEEYMKRYSGVTVVNDYPEDKKK